MGPLNIPNCTGEKAVDFLNTICREQNMTGLIRWDGSYGCTAEQIPSVCTGVLRVLLTDACALCWRGRCSSRFPPGRAEPLCPASWDFWEASSLSGDISAETCCTHRLRISCTDQHTDCLFSFLLARATSRPWEPPLFFFYTQMHTNTHHPADFSLFIYAPCDSWGCESFVQGKKRAKIQPTVFVVLSCCSLYLGNVWMN